MRETCFFFFFFFKNWGGLFFFFFFFFFFGLLLTFKVSGQNVKKASFYTNKTIYIASAKIPECEGSISPSTFYRQSHDY